MRLPSITWIAPIVIDNAIMLLASLISRTASRERNVSEAGATPKNEPTRTP